ncbi:MAG: LapA family protein [Nocardioides sp.]|uniref:LapA family protein n=1 Tax=Nocardioides sp. TaxID=35761 RepID=UPI0039E32AD5
MSEQHDDRRASRSTAGGAAASGPDPVEPSPGAADGADGQPVPDGAGAVDRPLAGLNSRGRVRRTRAGAAWLGLVLAALLAILFLIFILQNSRRVSIRFLGFDGHLPLAIALLLSAVTGMLLIAVPGAARIIQLRRALRKNAVAARPGAGR